MPNETKVTTNLGRVSIVPRGDYDPDTLYERLDLVEYNDEGYLAKHGGLIGVTPQKGEDWMQVVGSGSARLAESYTHGETGYRDGEETDNAKYYVEQAKTLADGVKDNVQIVRDNEKAIQDIERNLEIIEASPNNAKTALDNAILAKSYTVGETGTREGEDTDNAQYYYDQTKRIAGGVEGGFVPMGSVNFEELKKITAYTGWMYNILDAFDTDDTFEEGSGYHYSAGANVYWTANEKWDVLAAPGVTGVKGQSEMFYRIGNVDISADDVGAYSKEEVENRISDATNVDSLYEKLKARFMLDAYPIGSYYWSDKATNPGSLFGGTWVQIKDRFVLAAGDSYTVGGTGGNDSVTSGGSSAANTGGHAITTAEMAAHTHGVGTLTTVSNGNHYHQVRQLPQSAATGTVRLSGPYAGNSQIEGTNPINSTTDGAHTHTISGSTASVGSGTAHNHSMAHTHSVTTMPPYIVAYCWKRTA